MLKIVEKMSFSVKKEGFFAIRIKKLPEY